MNNPLSLNFCTRIWPSDGQAISCQTADGKFVGEKLTSVTLSDQFSLDSLGSDCYKLIRCLAVCFFLLLDLTVRPQGSDASQISSLSGRVNLQIISQIESSNQPHAVGDDGRSLGLYQLSAPVVAEYNLAHKTSFKHHSCALDALCSHDVAEWYINERIPQLLRHFKLPVTPTNQIVAYNAGIKAVKRGRIPSITRNYLRKYKALGGEL